MGDDAGLIDLMHAIASGQDIGDHLASDPGLATSTLRDRSAEFFEEACGAQVYAGATALHIAAASYDVDVIAALVELGADVGALDRRRATPLHAATRGGPGSAAWNPSRQANAISALVRSGADVDAAASGGVAPLHRAVRNRSAAAVRALLDAGADASLTNDSGSTPLDLTQWTTGRGGTGSDAARAELAEIVELLSGR